MGDSSSSITNDDTMNDGVSSPDRAVPGVVLDLIDLRMGDDGFGLEVEEATRFVKKVEACFQNDAYVDQSLSRILSKYRKNEASVLKVFEEVKMLFQNHQDLMEEFKNYLPNNFMMGSSRSEKPMDIDTASDDDDFVPDELDALSYLKIVKQTLHNDIGKYKEFLNILDDFKEERISTGIVKFKVEQLFEKHKILIPGFYLFLPQAYRN